MESFDFEYEVHQVWLFATKYLWDLEITKERKKCRDSRKMAVIEGYDQFRRKWSIPITLNKKGEAIIGAESNPPYEYSIYELGLYLFEAANRLIHDCEK